MGENDCLEELLRRWQQSAEQSDEITPEELCRDCPDLLPQLRDQIEALRHNSPDPAANTPDQDPPTVALDEPAEAAAPELVQIPGCTVEAELGRGGMGVVLRARDLTLGRPLAIKILLGKHGNHSEMEQRFLEEAQVMGQLQHPGVPAVHQLGRLQDGRPFFSMKLVRGQTLAQLLKERTSPADELPRFLAIFAQICETVAYAHSRGILHRDLKPANVMVGAFGEVQVMDWGLAKVLRSSEAEKAGRPPADLISTVRTEEGLSSQAGTVVGTPAYMASEQARGEVASLDERADVFGLGAILCVVLTGQPPYRGERESLRRQAAQGELSDAFARLLASGAHPELQALAWDCLARQREERPRDAGTVAKRITAYQQGVQERLRQAEMAQARAQARADEERKRRRVQLVLAALALLVVLAGGGAAWLFQQQRQVRAAEWARQQQAADRAADQAMANARLLLKQAKAAPLLEMGRFQEALAEARKAEQLAETGGASTDVRQQARNLARRIDQENRDAKRDQRLLAELLEVRGPREGPQFKADKDGFVVQLAEPSADAQFASAFRTWGLDVDATPRAAALARLKERPAAVLVEVIAALDEWAMERRASADAANWQHLTKLAQALDSPDSKRRELRALLARGNLSLERALGMVSLALRPVPIPFDVGPGKDRARLRRLAVRTDAAKEPVLGLLTLVRALNVAGDEALAERLLKAALLAQPKEVVLHHSLGQLLEKKTPPRWREALEWYRAARTLRPDLGDSLAYALIKVGRADEGVSLYKQLDTNNPRNPWLRFRRGVALGTQGRSREAEAAFRDALRLKADIVEAHSGLGITLRDQGRLLEAEAAQRAALRLRPADAGAHVNLGNALLDQGRFKEAEAAYRKAAWLKPEDFLAHYALGVVLYKQNRFKEAEAECRVALRRKPDDPGTHSHLGLALAGQGRLKEAEAEYRTAIRLKPAEPIAHTNLGLALYKQGRLPEAEAECRAAIRLKPTYPQAHYNLGNILNGQGRPREAEAVCREALRLKADSPQAHTNLGAALRSQGRLKEAEAACREALRLKADLPEAHYNLGAILAMQSRFKEAEAAARQALRFKADFPEALYCLGNALTAQGRSLEAEAAFRAAVGFKADFAEAHVNLGNALRAQGRSREAEAAYREAIRRNPDVAEVHPNLAFVLSDQGRYKEAEAACRAALRRKPGYPQVHTALGVVLGAQGRFVEAEAAHRTALRLKPAYPEAHCNLGWALQQQGRFAESLETYRQGHALGTKRPRWPYPSARWSRTAERLVELDAKLPAVLAGDAEPASAAERLELASLCQRPARRRHAAAARLAAAAFAAEPDFANDLENQYRYNAACSAALAAAGQAVDAGKLTDKDKASLRQQALGWLHADLAAYGKLAEGADPKRKQLVRQRLGHWQTDAALARLRDPEALGKLPEAERDAWSKLWADVEAVWRRAGRSR